jgi:DNA-binding response OmpR family regulator
VTASDGAQAVDSARANQPDLVVLDLMLPGLDGFEVCRLLRRDPALARTPVIFLSARTEEMDRIVAFELGADDYVTKPFSPRELILRIRRSLERQKTNEALTAFTCGDLVIDLPRHEVIHSGERVQLTATEFKLLEVLVQRRGYLFSRAQLLQEVWKYDHDFESRTVDTHVRRLREKLGDAAPHIETVRGAGYRFVLDV